MKKKSKRPLLKSLILAALIAVLATTQRSKASYYDNYLSAYNYYYNQYLITGVPQYYYDAIGFYYYYAAGFYGDYYGYYSDPVGFKSVNYRGSTTYAAYYYGYYVYYGDYYIRL